MNMELRMALSSMLPDKSATPGFIAEMFSFDHDVP